MIAYNGTYTVKHVYLYVDFSSDFQPLQYPITLNKKGNSELVSGYLLLYTMDVAKSEKALCHLLKEKHPLILATKLLISGFFCSEVNKLDYFYSVA